MLGKQILIKTGLVGLKPLASTAMASIA